MPRALIVTEPPVAPEPFRLALLGIGYNVVDEIDDAQRLVKRAIAIEPDVIIVGADSPSKNLLASAQALNTRPIPCCRSHRMQIAKKLMPPPPAACIPTSSMAARRGACRR